MIILDFLVKNYAFLIMLVGMFIITLFDVYLGKGMKVKLRVVFLMLLALEIFDHLESYTSTLEHFTYWRIVLSVICYTLRPMIIMMLAFIVSPKINIMIILPAAVNFLIVSSALFSDIAFGFDAATNSFYRGPLGYTTYVITVLYILLLYFITIKALASRVKEQSIILSFIAVTATFAALLTFWGHDEVVQMTYAADVMLYYMYLYAEYTKHDPLTAVFNRQTFYNDIRKRPQTITGIISADMNDLKWRNDNYGHKFGDYALVAIADCLCRCSTSNERVYRVGGDEFMVVCRKRTPEEMETLISNFRKEIAKGSYSCAFGLSYGKSVDEMILESDELMYEDKKMIKAQLRQRDAAPVHVDAR